jgi:hypothetical protein
MTTNGRWPVVPFAFDVSLCEVQPVTKSYDCVSLTWEDIRRRYELPGADLLNGARGRFCPRKRDGTLRSD